MTPEEVRKRVLEIQARAEKATPGDWISGDMPWDNVASTESDTSVCYDVSRVEDAEFIAASRQDVPWLCEKLLKVQEVSNVQAIQLPTISCPFCNYEWIPRILLPTRCPQCAKVLAPKGKLRASRA